MNIDNEIEKTLKSLDGMKKVKVRPFFYTRLEARLHANISENRRQRSIAWITLASIVLLNAFAYFAYESRFSNDVQSSAVVSWDTEYSASNDIYTLIENYED